MKMKHLAVLVLASASASVAFAQAKPEQQIEYRKSAMVVTARSSGALNAMAKGDVPFDKEQAARHAVVIANQIELAFAGGAFGPGTDKAAPTKADPKVWSEPEKFKAALDKYALAAKAVPAAAGDVALLKTALGDLGKACKACHDDYRMK